MKKLTLEQIDQLFDFTKKHYVEHYDVQVELVDHLANAIEEQWTENPNISFEDALDVEFKKFGIFGFTGLVEQKQAELHKSYNKMLWQQVLQFISIPKVVLTMCLYLGIYFFLKNTHAMGETIVLTSLLFSYTYFMIDGLRFIFKMQREQKKKQRSWLIQSVAQSVFSLPTISLGGIYYTFISRFFEQQFGFSNSGLYFLAFFVLFQCICMYVFYKVIKPHFIKTIQETEKRYQIV